MVLVQNRHRTGIVSSGEKKKILLATAIEIGFSKHMLSEVLLMPSLCLDVQGGALRYIEELSLGEPALVAENISCIG